MNNSLRQPQPQDYEPLALLWRDGWREAHQAHVPAELTALRTLPDFLRRLREFGDALRVAGPIGAPSGFCAVVGNHIDQLFVAPLARASGIAARLLSDGEDRIARTGAGMAELECVIENYPARRFYLRQGWSERGIETAILKTSAGAFHMDCMIFEKPVS